MKKGFSAALALGIVLLLFACSRTEDEVRRIANESVATALALVPTATPAPTVTPQPTPSPQPTATPQPTPMPMVFPATPTPAPTPTPTTVPTPTSASPSSVVAAGGQASGPAVFKLAGDFSLKIEPGEPFSGRDVTFTLAGLPVWQPVTVEFIDPLGRPVQWVTENDVRIIDARRIPVTTNVLYSDASGEVTWVRVGAKNREGVWSVRVTIDGETSSVTYSVGQLQLPSQETETVGVELRRYEGSVSNAFYSSLVPAALVVGLQAHLARVVERLGEDLGEHSRQIPDLCLTGNTNLLQQVAQATGDNVGFEDGYYRSEGTRPGIYMRTNFFESGVHAILTHEYTHLLLQEVAEDESLPAWLNEGMARNSEYTLGLESIRPDAARVQLYRAADLANTAVSSGTLPALTTLESQTEWNSQTDESRIDLQYAEAYMAVRFMAETYSATAPIRVVQAIGRGSPLPAAILEVTKDQYRDFRLLFAEWLQEREDPDRANIETHIRSLGSIIDSADLISERRAADLESGAPLPSRIQVQRNLVTDSEALVDRAANLIPPAALVDLHQDASTYLTIKLQWLTLELNYAETLEEAKLIQANDMIPQITARDTLLKRAIATVEFVYNLQE